MVPKEGWRWKFDGRERTLFCDKIINKNDGDKC